MAGLFSLSVGFLRLNTVAAAVASAGFAFLVFLAPRASKVFSNLAPKCIRSKLAVQRGL
jgi:hypothetical protein